MKPIPKTIQIFLPGGDPRGLRVAEITTRIVQLIEVPRSLLGEFLKMPESSQVGVYALVGTAENGVETQVYLGQSGNVGTRLSLHGKDKGKDFWERALVLISRTNSLTQTHALFLEWHCLQACRKAGRYVDVNGNAGSKPHTPAPLEADCLEIFETGRVLLATLGFPIFEPLVEPTAGSREDELFHCTAVGAKGRGLLTSEGFVVLKGSIGRRANVPSIKGTPGARLRERLIAAKVMAVEGDRVVFRKDHLFSSPSTAALALLGRTANGWREWKTQSGEKLDAFRRA